MAASGARRSAEPDRPVNRESTWLGDDAIEDDGADRLGRAGFSLRMSEVISSVADQTPSAVFGLIGAWGSGKTSVLNLLRAELSTNPGWSIVEFNPWLLNDVEALTAELMGSVASVLPEQGQVRRKLASFTQRIAPYSAVGSIFGFDPSKGLGVLGRRLAGDRSLDGQRKELEAAMRQDPRRVLVLIDDVDRLQGDELSALLKLVRLVGRLPNVYYVLSYDEQTLLDVLGTTDVAGGKQGRGLAYLDKIVQVRLDLPAAPQVLLAALVNEALDRVSNTCGVKLTNDDHDRLSAAYGEHMRPLLNEPRHVKRYFGQVEALLPLVQGEVDFVDFLLVTLLRTFYPAVYALLPAHQPELTGTEFTMTKPSPDERRAKWQDRLGSAPTNLPPYLVEPALGLLAELFPALSPYSGYRSGGLRMSSPEYFGRYVHLSIAPDDVPDALVRRALAELAVGSEDGAAADVLAHLGDAGEIVVEKLRRFSPSDPIAARKTIPYAGRVICETPDGSFLERAHLAGVAWLADLIAVADLSDPETLVGDLVALTDIRDVVQALRIFRDGRDRIRVPLSPPQQLLEAEIVAALVGEIERQGRLSPAETDRPLGLLLDWSRLVDAATVRKWTQERIRAGTPWSVEDVVALFVPIQTSHAGSSLGDLDLRLLEELVGVGFVLSQFTPTRDPGAWNAPTVISLDARRRIAHDALASEAEIRAAGSPP